MFSWSTYFGGGGKSNDNSEKNNQNSHVQTKSSESSLNEESNRKLETKDQKNVVNDISSSDSNKNKVKTKNIDNLFYEPNKPNFISPIQNPSSIISKTQFFSIYGSFLSAGIVGGAYWFYRREKVDLKIKSNASSYFLAFKALGIGSLLAFGGFAGIISLFSFATGINSLSEFSEASRNFTKRHIFIQKDNKKELDEDEIEKVFKDFYRKLDFRSVFKINFGDKKKENPSLESSKEADKQMEGKIEEVLNEKQSDNTH